MSTLALAAVIPAGEVYVTLMLSGWPSCPMPSRVPGEPTLMPVRSNGATIGPVNATLLVGSSQVLARCLNRKE
jgi:hypothetical protein